MAAIDTNATRVRVSATLVGTYTLVGYTRSFEFTEGTEGGGREPYFGGELRRAGDNTVSGSLTLFYDPADTLGQEVLRTAKRNGTTVFLQLCPAGTGAGAKCEQLECYITETGMSSDRGSNFVERTISYEGIPSTLSTITLA